VVRNNPIVPSFRTSFHKVSRDLIRLSTRWYFVACLCFALAFTCVCHPRRSEYVQTKGLLHGKTLWSDTARFYATFDRHFEELTGFPPCLAGVTIDGQDANFIQQFEALRYLRGQSVSLTLLNLDRESQEQVGVFYSKNISSVCVESCDGTWIKKLATCLPDVHEVVIFECRDLDDENLGHLRLCTQLKRLSIDGSNVRGSCLLNLPQTVEELEITNSVCDVESCIRHASRFPRITNLTLQGNGQLVDPMLLTRMEAIQKINLIDVTVNQSDATELRRRLPKATIFFT
jgi:hypothetical protein